MVELLTVSAVLNLFLLYKLFGLARRHVKLLGLLFKISKGEATIKYDGEELEIKNT
jgi:hypothetical protein